MGLLRMVVMGLVVGWAAVRVRRLLQEPPMPVLDPNPWWGPGQPQADDISIFQFSINIPSKEVEDLQTRLALPLRLTPALEGANFTYGFNSDTLKRIVNYWRNKYDWRERQTKLNKYSHYKTTIEGLDIHFLRAGAKTGGRQDVKVVPLLLVHGWPGSFVEFYGILPLLTTPQEGSSVVFEVICPSIPGYGFSQGSSKQGLGILETGQIFLKLMKRLGYNQFYVQGGDWGSMITTDMATMYPQNILGIHVNFFASITPGINMKLVAGSVLPAGVVVAAKDQDHLYPLSSLISRIMQEMGYSHIQATKPDTIGSVLNQSPVALAAYILEKFSTWTHQDNTHLPDGGLLRQDFPISMDALLDNVCVYWFSGSITTSVRFYAENMGKDLMARDTDSIPCRVPAGLSIFPQELFIMPKNFVEHKFYNIVTYSEQTAGGHFAAMERPELLAADVHNFVSVVEGRK